jgi:hypothetical protein
MNYGSAFHQPLLPKNVQKTCRGKDRQKYYCRRREKRRRRLRVTTSDWRKINKLTDSE